MITNDTGRLIWAIASAYPNSEFAKMESARMEQTVKIWTAMLNMELNDAMAALSYHVRTSKFPPTIADLYEGLYASSHPMALSEAEAWALVFRASHNGIYHSEEEFEKLPAECQRALGSPDVLKDLAMATNNDVASSNFKRAYRRIMDEHKKREMACLPTHSQDRLDASPRPELGKMQAV